MQGRPDKQAWTRRDSHNKKYGSGGPAPGCGGGGPSRPRPGAVFPELPLPSQHSLPLPGIKHGGGGPHVEGKGREGKGQDAKASSA